MNKCIGAHGKVWVQHLIWYRPHDIHNNMLCSGAHIPLYLYLLEALYLVFK